MLFGSKEQQIVLNDFGYSMFNLTTFILKNKIHKEL